ncbi:hypothetical protein BCU91_05135 [Shewanella sp. 10N.286.52.B9]|nr:hypothetical protein BCU91_05135 [Shewanella sp. 10N.286.52.B9]
MILKSTFTSLPKNKKSNYMSPEEIELYKDAVKIGFPAFAGLIAGFIPYLLERSKVKQEEKSNNQNFRRAKINELIDCFSSFSGKLYGYTSHLLSIGMYPEKSQVETLKTSGFDMLSQESNLSKAKAIAGLLGNSEIVNKVNEFDTQATETINTLNNSKALKEQKLESIRLLRIKETEFILVLKNLL